MRSRRFGKTLETFSECLRHSRQGKTFIFHHPEFVAMDRKSYEELRRKSEPIAVYIDEFQTLTDAQLRELTEITQRGRV